MKYYIIAGEASGDLHGSNLVKHIRKLDVTATVRGWGGDKMEQAGVQIVMHYRKLAFMGFVEVIRNLRTILRNLRYCKQDITQFDPDVLILIDYPGFNLRIAQWAKQAGKRVVYYISPQVWAWKESRVNAIKRSVDKMLVILPFEEEFYESRKYKVEYVGHPLIEVVRQARAEHQLSDVSNSPLNQKNIVALLPGSREQEVAQKLPLMLKASLKFPAYHFVIAKAPSLEDSFYEPFLRGYPRVRSVRDKTYDLLMRARAALVTSGTATLETALFDVPQVVCYRGGFISYHIARRLVKVKFISLVNLIMNREVITELIQHNLTVANIEKELDKILHNADAIRDMKESYNALTRLLNKNGNASENAAQSIIRFLKYTTFEKQPA